MIEFNNTFCPYCCNIFRSYVYVTNDNEYVTIKQNKAGKYAIHNYENCKNIRKIKIIEMEKLNGLPYRTIIEIKYSNEKQERQEVLTSSKRVCPHCLKSGQKKRALTYGNYAPTFLIIDIGLPSAGKTALTQSITYAENFKKAISNNFFIQPVYTPKRMDKLVATPINATDVFYEFRIIDKKGSLIANVVMIDTPGEFTLEENMYTFGEFYSRFFKYLQIASHINYVVDGEKAISGNKTSTRQARLLQDIFSTQKILKKTSVVLTKIDILRKQLKEERLPMKNAGSVVLNYNTPIFSGNMNLIELKRLSKYIIRNLNTEVCTLIPAESSVSYFTVSAGNEREDGSLNYDNSLNINSLLTEIFSKL